MSYFRSVVYGNESSHLSLLHRTAFSGVSIFHVPVIAGTHNNCISGLDNWSKIQKNGAHIKNVPCIIHLKIVLHLWHVSNEAVWGNDYSQILNAYIGSDAKIFQQSALPTRTDPSSYNTWSPFPSEWPVSNFCIWWNDRTNEPAKAHNFWLPYYYRRRLMKDKALVATVSNIIELKRKVTPVIRPFTEEKLGNVSQNSEYRFHAIIWKPMVL